MRRFLLLLLLIATPLQWSWAIGALPQSEACPCGSPMPADPSAPHAFIATLVATAFDDAAEAAPGVAATDGCCEVDCTHCQGQVAPGLIASPVRLAALPPDRLCSDDVRPGPAPLADELLRPPRTTPR
jgi:hypothetical protein